MAEDRIEQIKHEPATLRCYTSRLQFRRLGKDYEANCPFHEDTRPSFQVFEKDGMWMWKCQSGGCGVGNVVQFVERFDHIAFAAAMRKVEDEIGSSWENNRQQVETTFREFGGQTAEKIVYSLEQYAKLETALLKSPAAREWLLTKRGITFETAQRLHFGFRQDLGKIAGQDSRIADKGWIAIPCIVGGKVVSIEYRSIVEKDFRRQPGMNTALMGADGLDPFDVILVTEGKFDAAVLEQAGFRAVSLPNASTKLTPEMRDQLKAAGTIILAGDSDPAGEAAMGKLWAELQDNTYLLKWPDGCKDANDLFLKDPAGFRETVERLIREARGTPMPNVTSLQEAMVNSQRTNMADHPDRLHFPWKSVDQMVNLLPGSVLSLFATNTGMGKTTFAMNIAVHEARRGEIILNYSEELAPEEYGNLVAAHVLKKDRNLLTQEDYALAAQMLGQARFYIGRNLDLRTADEVLDLIEAAMRRLGPTLVIIDHLHIIVRNVADPVKAQDNAMKRILQLAARYRAKMIVIGQPRKAISQNRGKRVHITDAKGAASFGDDAHAVIAIHRDLVKHFDPANPPREPYEPKTEIHLQKGRSQGTGNAYAELMFFGSLASFEQICYDAPPVQAELGMAASN